VVFGADDVGQHAVLHDLTGGVFGHETAGDAGDRGLDGHASVEESEGTATDGSHRGGAVGFHDLGDETDGVREVLLGRQHGEQRALGEVTVAGFAAGGHAEAAGLTHREGREVVVQEERALARAAGDGVDFLGILGGTEGREDETLGFAALEERGTMDARKHVDFAGDGAEIQRLAAVGTFAALDDSIAVDLLLELFEGHLDLAGVEDVAEFSLTGSLGLLDHGLHGVATFLLGSEEDRLLELVAFGGHAFTDSEGLRFADDEREDALGLGVHRGELALGGDDRLDGLLGVFEGGDEVGFGQLVGRTFDHHHVALVADVDEVQVRLILLFVGRVDDELAGDATEADTGDRSVPRNVGAKESGGSAVHHEHVGVVDLVSREEEADHLDFVEEAFGEERAEGTVAEARGQDFLIGRLTFATEVTARETAGCRELLAVVDGQGEEVLVGGAQVFGGGSRHEERGLALADGDRAVGEAGDGARVDRDTEFFDGHGVFLFHVCVCLVRCVGRNCSTGFCCWWVKSGRPSLGWDAR